MAERRKKERKRRIELAKKEASRSRSNPSSKTTDTRKVDRVVRANSEAARLFKTKRDESPQTGASHQGSAVNTNEENIDLNYIKTKKE